MIISVIKNNNIFTVTKHRIYTINLYDSFITKVAGSALNIHRLGIGRSAKWQRFGRNLWIRIGRKINMKFVELRKQKVRNRCVNIDEFK